MCNKSYSTCTWITYCMQVMFYMYVRIWTYMHMLHVVYFYDVHKYVCIRICNYSTFIHETHTTVTPFQNEYP